MIIRTVPNSGESAQLPSGEWLYCKDNSFDGGILLRIFYLRPGTRSNRFFRGGLLYLTLLSAISLSLLPGCATTLAPAGPNDVASPLVTDFTATSVDDSDDSKAQQFFIRGLTQAFLDQHSDAIRLYEQALQHAPNSPAILSAVAESEEALGDMTNAFYYARLACDLDPDNEYYFRQLARMYLSIGDYENAADTYGTLIEKFPDDVQAQYELARVFSLNNQPAEAIHVFETILESYGEDFHARRELLRLYLQIGDEQNAEQTLLTLIEQQPHNTSFRRMLGELYLRRDKPDQAVSLFEQTLEMNPADFEVALGLAELYRRLGDTDKADALLERSIAGDRASSSQLIAQAAHLYARIGENPEIAETIKQLLVRVLEKEPRHPDALFMLGDIFYLEENFEQAGVYLQQALQENPRDPQVWHQASLAYLQAGLAEQATEIADEGLLLFPGQVPILRLSGYAHMELYHNDVAISRFEETLNILLEDSPGELQLIGEMYGALGLLYSRKRETVASDEAYLKAIESDPDNDLALNNYAYSLAGRNVELSKALDMGERAVALQEENASYMDTLGWIHFLMNNLDEAEKWIGKAVETGQASATVYEHYGDIHERLGHTDDARFYWQKALEMNPDNTTLRQKLEQS